MILWLYFGLLTLFWGMSFIAIRVALESFPPFAAAGLRVFIGALILLAVVAFKRKPLRAPKQLMLKFIGVGILNYGVAWSCLFWGEQFVIPGVASILNSTVPLFVSLTSWFLLKSEKPLVSDWMGAILGFIGIVIVFLPSVKGFGQNPMELYGLAAIVVMAIAYSVATVLIRKWGGGISSEWSFILQALGGTTTLALLSMSTESTTWVSQAVHAPKAIAGILYLALFSTALAWLMYYKLIMSWGAIRTSVITYCMPFVSIVVDWLYFGNKPGTNHVVGGILILSALAILRLSKGPSKKNSVPNKVKLAA